MAERRVGDGLMQGCAGETPLASAISESCREEQGINNIKKRNSSIWLEGSTSFAN